jgi:hypothetical protein
MRYLLLLLTIALSACATKRGTLDTGLPGVTTSTEVVTWNGTEWVPAGYESSGGWQAITSHPRSTARKKNYSLPGVTTAHAPNIPSIALGFVSGAFFGVHETVVHRPGRIPPRWNRDWWEPSRSWQNKYAGGDPRNGPRFPGSTGALEFTTGAKPFFGTGHRTMLFLSGVTLTIGERKPLWHYAVDFGLSALAFNLGYHSMYSSNLIFRD